MRPHATHRVQTAARPICWLAAVVAFAATACDDGASPVDVDSSSRAEARTIKASSVLRHPDETGLVETDLTSPAVLQELITDFRSASLDAPPQLRANLVRTVEILEARLEEVERAVPRVATDSQTAEMVALGDDPPGDDGGIGESTTYMNLTKKTNSTRGGYDLVGVTVITDPPDAKAKMYHTVNYSVDNVSRTVNDASGGSVPIHITRISVDCVDTPKRISGRTDAKLNWVGGGTTFGTGTLGPRDCEPHKKRDETVPAEEAPPGGSTPCDEDDTCTPVEWCLVRTWYWVDTGEIISREVLFCS